MSAIENDAPGITQDLVASDFEGDAGAFLKLWNEEDAEETKKPKPSDDSKDTKDTDEEPDTSEDDESPSDDDEGDTDESDEPEAKKPTIAGDDAIVKVKVDGKETDWTVADLKRLAGQETALTRKSEEVATARKQVEEAGKAHMTGLTKLLENARARFEPYSKIDFLVASKELSAPELQALRTEADKAYADIKFLETELDTTMRAQEVERQQAIQKQAVECIKVLTDPKDGIPGWNESLYSDIRAYAVSHGIPQADINQLVDPVAFKFLHKAMLYDKGKSVVTTKVDKQPKKIVKTTTSDKKALVTKTDTKALEAKARKTGDVDDVAELFLSRWADDER